MMCAAATPPAERRMGFEGFERAAMRLRRRLRGGWDSRDLSVLRCGYAAGCEVGLRPTARLKNFRMGYAPGPGFALKLLGQARTRGIAQTSGYFATAGRSPASHPAAKPHRSD